MSGSEMVGFVGVGLLLLAFSLRSLGYLDGRRRTYQSLNLIGAGLACYASVLIGFLPFVVLEGAWAIVAAVALARAPAA